MKTALCALALLVLVPQDDPAKNLKSKDVGSRLTALEMLSKEKSAKNEKAVASALKDDDWEVVEKAAEVLGKIGGPGSIDDLVKLAIDGPIARVRTTAALALADVDAVAACEALAKKATGKEAGRPLEAIATITARKEAKYELDKLEKIAESSKDDRARFAAARAIVGANAPDRVDLLVKLCTNAHPEVACAALDAALARPDARRCGPLTEVLSHGSLPDLVERRGAQALSAAIASSKTEATGFAEKHLATLLGAKEAAVAARGVRTLTALAPTKTVDHAKLLELLRPALAHAQAGVRAEAAAALASLSGDDAWKEARSMASGDKDERVRRAALVAATRSKGASTPDTRTLLLDRLATDASAEVRIVAATALGVAKNEEARAGLEKAIADKDWGVGTCAAVSLGKLRGAASIATLAELSKKSPDWKLRGAAVEGLVQTVDKASIPAIIEAIADADPCVQKCAHVFLCAMAGETLPPKVEAWREWWAKKGAALEMRDPRRLPSTGAAPAEGTVAPVLAKPQEIWRDLDAIVLESRGDHIQTVLEKQSIPHRLTSAGKVGESGVHPGAVFVANCTGEIEERDVERLRWFVLAGGHLFGSCWALHETIERALPGVVRKAETASEVLDHVPAHDCSGGSPYVAGVFQEGVVPVYALEGAHLIEVVAPERAEVLLDSPEALAHWGCGNLAVLFTEGHGTVVDSVNHFEAQDFQTVEGLKSPADRQAWAMDHMGLGYEAWRKTKGEKWWDNSVRASANVQDLSVFRLVTNIVRLRRGEVPK